MEKFAFQSVMELFPDMESPAGVPVIAGPCSAENEERVIAIARGVKKAGAGLFRAGLWKPRTRPGCFEGVGANGLPWLRKARALTGLKFITEVATREHVICALNGGCDGIWIGARTSANPFAVQEISDALKERGADIPVLVKNPVNPDLELWAGAIERIYSSGIRKIAAIHRGFSRYGDKYYRNPPLWSIPIELKRRMPGLKIFHDPSHCGGKRDLIGELSQQALDLGFDGLMIETHTAPDDAWSDAAQQITPSDLGLILDSLLLRHGADSPATLPGLREEIDLLDAELVRVLSQRMEICRKIGELKKAHGMPVIQPDRYSRLLSDRIAGSSDSGLGKRFLENIFSSVHAESVRQQLELMKNADASPSRKK